MIPLMMALIALISTSEVSTMNAAGCHVVLFVLNISNASVRDAVSSCSSIMEATKKYPMFVCTHKKKCGKACCVVL